MPSTENTEAGISRVDDAFYIECSLPTSVTIAEYRRSRPRRPSLWKRVARRTAA
jgi:hypothetical protein